MNTEPKQYAFWKTDLFPYVTGGTITNTVPKIAAHLAGYVETEEYGKGNFFKPILIVPLEIGKIINDKFKEITLQRQKDVDSLSKIYKDKLLNILAEIYAAVKK